jgi:thioredoxin-like negative regulator of GroEL
VPEAALAAALRAEAHYRRADAIPAGGWGLLPTAEVAARRAWLALVRREPGEAAGHLERAVRARPHDRTLRVELAGVHALAGLPERAEEELARLIAEDPADDAPHRTLASVLERRGDREGAVAELIVVVNLAPGDAAARSRLVHLLQALGRHDDAARYAQGALVNGGNRS